MVDIASAWQNITPEGEDAGSGYPYTFLIYDPNLLYIKNSR